MASCPAIELRFAPGDGRTCTSRAPETPLQELLYAELDTFEPLAIDEDDTGTRWRVFFRTAQARDAAQASLAAAFGPRLESLAATDVDDEDWARRSQSALARVRIGRIVVCPPWDLLSAPSPSDRVIQIVPSMGFGTGHHATTRLCLELLQQLDLSGRTVIDVGTGSGVLAIAARRLGAASVTAIDNDPDALENARENIARNGVADAIAVCQIDFARCHLTADVVLANLTGVMLQRSARELAGLVAPGGHLVVSGFCPEERGDVVGAIGGTVLRGLTEGEWAAALMVTDRRT